jgi:hypothetical protein
MPFAAAQTSGPVASGTFTGSVNLGGGFLLNLPEGFVAVTASGSGPLNLTLTDGVMDGTWSLTADQKSFGTLGPEEAAILLSGEGSISASGTMVGPPSNYRMKGSHNSTMTATVSMPVIGSQSSTSTDSGTLDEQLTDVLLLCDQIVGRWDLRVRQDIQDAGFVEFIRGYFSASTGVDATEQAAEVEQLIADIGQWAADAGSVEEDDLFLYVDDGRDLLEASQLLQAELEVDTPCPPDPTFATELSLAAQDALSALIDLYPGEVTTPATVSLAYGAGALGAGSPNPAEAAALKDKMILDVLDKWDAQIEDPDALPEELVTTALAAEMLGVEEFRDGRSPADAVSDYFGGS